MKKVLDHHNPTLTAIINKARQLGQLDLLVKQHLPKDSCNDITVANLEDGCLVIGCHNASRATMLRYLCPTLLSNLRAGGLPQLRSIKILVLPAEN